MKSPLVARRWGQRDLSRLVGGAILGGALLASGCHSEERGPAGGDRAPTRDQANAKARPNAAGSDAPGALNGSTQPQLRAGYLLVLGSFRATGDGGGAVPKEVSDRRPESVQVVQGFPRAADAREARALRSGYGAWLAGVCAERKDAEEILALLSAEFSDAYLKRSEEPVEEACPRVNERWKLGHELVLAIQSDRPDSEDLVRDLLGRGAPVDHGRGSGTPLNLAAYENDVPVVRLLLSAGAKVNVAGRAPQEESTLELALRSPHGEALELVKLLVARGADVHARTEGAEADPGSTVEVAAARRCDPRVLEFLYAQGMRRGSVDAEEVCRDRQPPLVPESDRAWVERLVRGAGSGAPPTQSPKTTASP